MKDPERTALLAELRRLLKSGDFIVLSRTPECPLEVYREGMTDPVIQLGVLKAAVLMHEVEMVSDMRRAAIEEEKSGKPEPPEPTP